MGLLNTPYCDLVQIQIRALTNSRASRLADIFFFHQLRACHRWPKGIYEDFFSFEVTMEIQLGNEPNKKRNILKIALYYGPSANLRQHYNGNVAKVYIVKQSQILISTSRSPVTGYLCNFLMHYKLTILDMEFLAVEIKI